MELYARNRHSNDEVIISTTFGKRSIRFYVRKRNYPTILEVITYIPNFTSLDDIRNAIRKNYILEDYERTEPRRIIPIIV